MLIRKFIQHDRNWKWLSVWCLGALRSQAANLAALATRAGLRYADFWAFDKGLNEKSLFWPNDPRSAQEAREVITARNSYRCLDGHRDVFDIDAQIAGEVVGDNADVDVHQNVRIDVLRAEGAARIVATLMAVALAFRIFMMFLFDVVMTIGSGEPTFQEKKGSWLSSTCGDFLPLLSGV